MVHKVARTFGIVKYKPWKMIGFDYVDNEFQSIDLFPESRVVVIHSSHAGEPNEVREWTEGSRIQER